MKNGTLYPIKVFFILAVVVAFSSTTNAPFKMRELTAGEVERIFEILRNLKSTPYVWGGTSEYGIDCSGLVIFLLNKLGFKKFVYKNTLVFDVTADNLFKYNTKPLKDIKELRKGDLIFFDMNEDGVYDHVAVFEQIDSQGVFWCWDAAEMPDGIHQNKVDRRPILSLSGRKYAFGRILVVVE
uniref:Peptidoglycan endopeptidase n=1 Tax=Fervidobacterium thailandense TaxID=1008305 RepID=A0A7C4RV22_9BACT